MAIDKIIVLDDEKIIRYTLEAQLRKRRYSVATASTIAEAENYLSKDSFDLMFVDVRLPDGDGIQLLERLTQEPGGPLVVMITGHGSIESAVRCMKIGAFDYVIKPFSIDLIEVILKKAESYNQLIKVNQYLNDGQLAETGLVGECSSMIHLRRIIKKVAATDATVLISGENGTGKELVAQELYRLSPRSSQPYIKVNCGAISETLIESEFFGHEKGAFTGATQRREGRFELANNGTILLDKVGEISPQMQVKLLRVLQEQEFERVGGNKTIRVNVRIIASTNRDLVKSVKNGDFREDLYYRLNVFPIWVPPLRERNEDVPLLADMYLKHYSSKHGINVPQFTRDAKDLMIKYSWPGNVRELQNTIERAVILTDTGSDVPGYAMNLVTQGDRSDQRPVVNHVSNPSLAIEDGKTESNGKQINNDIFKTLDQLEQEHILQALKKTQGNRKEASNLLKISTRTLRNKLNRYQGEGTEISLSD